jgi:hypothetical protein
VANHIPDVSSGHHNAALASVSRFYYPERTARSATNLRRGCVK